MNLLFLAMACTPAGYEGFWVVLEGRVLDEAGAGLAGATVALAAGDGSPIAELQTDEVGDWRMPVVGATLVGNAVVALTRAEGFAEGRATFEVNLRSPEVTTLRGGPVQTWTSTTRRLPAIRLANDADAATVSGRLIDAITGEPAVGLPLVLQAGWNAPLGASAAGDVVTGSSGEFTFFATKPGMYTVSASASGGYGGARFPAFLTASGGQTVATVVPPTAPGELRASLVWGPSPFDLDLHLSAPLKGGVAGEDGTGQYHVWAAAPQHPDDLADAEVEAQMERIDSDGDGPESVWVGAVADRGDLRLSVFDNDNRSDADTVALAASGALLQVWFGEDFPRYYTVSPGETATLWQPVEMDTQTALTYAVELWSTGADPADPAVF